MSARARYEKLKALQLKISKFQFGLVIAMIAIATVARFLFLSLSPPGFYIDEAAISAQIICLRQSGYDLFGNHWPLFSQVLGGGFATPPYLHSGVVWTSIFGDSISSFRGLTAFFSALFIGGSFVFGTRFWKSREAGWFCALAAALSPWAFQFSRIAWDPALAPALSVWAFAFLWADGRNKKIQMVAAGILLSLAAYSYPPLRVQLAIMTTFAILILWLRERRKVTDLAIAVAVATLASVPLLKMTFSGELQARFAMLSVFNENYLRQFGEPSFALGLQQLFTNIMLNFSPSYLFSSGDANLRHSTQSFGTWGWLDIFAVLVALGAFIGAIKARKTARLPWLAIGFVIVGYVAGVLPAAMTWESNPHALRSIGAVVFLVLGVGGILRVAWHILALREALLVISAAFIFFFAQVYALTYPERAYLWFDTVVAEAAHQLAHQGRAGDLHAELRRSGIDYNPLAVSYYELASGARTCRAP